MKKTSISNIIVFINSNFWFSHLPCWFPPTTIPTLLNLFSSLSHLFSYPMLLRESMSSFAEIPHQPFNLTWYTTTNCSLQCPALNQVHLSSSFFFFSVHFHLWFNESFLTPPFFFSAATSVLVLWFLNCRIFVGNQIEIVKSKSYFESWILSEHHLVSVLTRIQIP